MPTQAEQATKDPFVRITRQNHYLLEAIRKDDFDGFLRLDPTLNQAITLIHAANEIIVRYPQGSFPLHRAYPMVYTTMHLLKACERRYGRVKVKAMYQAFCKLFRLWFYNGAPRCPAELYVKKIFQGEDQLLTAICDHNRNIAECEAPVDARIVEVVPCAGKSLRAAMKDPGGHPPKTAGGVRIMTQAEMAVAFGEPCNADRIANWEARAAGKKRGANPPDAEYKGQKIIYSAELRTNPTPDNIRRLSALIAEFQARRRVKEAVREKATIHCRFAESLYQAQKRHGA